MQKSYYKFLFYFTIAIILFSYYCALKIGLNPDEAFHHANGAVRYLYLKSSNQFDISNKIKSNLDDFMLLF